MDDVEFKQLSFYIFSAVLGLIILLMGLALIVDLAYSLFLQPDATKPFFVKLILCFSPYSNLKGIAKTTDTNAGGQIGCLNGMRHDFLTTLREYIIFNQSFLQSHDKQGHFDDLGCSVPFLPLYSWRILPSQQMGL